MTIATTTGIVYAAIVPHGTSAIEGAAPTEESAAAAETQRAMAELAQRFDAAQVDATIVLTPHNVHVEGAMAVIEAGTLRGDLSMWGAGDLALSVTTDRSLAAGMKQAVREAGVPVVGISFGANDAAASTHPMDWGLLVPFWFFGGRAEPPVPGVGMSPARDLAPADHVRAGQALAAAAAASGRRVALIASCDHGHGHDASGPYGLRPESAQFDDRVVGLLRRGDGMAELLDIPQDFVAAAAADSWWQMLMLHGALGDGWRSELLSYQHPTYFGMICAAMNPSAG
jgi:aromatic ring-opening dioxygenase LigB subunit